MSMFNASPRVRTWRALIALMASLALVAAACGDDGDDDVAVDEGTGDPANPGDGGASGDCGEALTIGILVPLTGELGDFGISWQNSMELAVERIDESGALPEGWEITTVVGDERTDPEEGLRAAQQMISSDNVSAIVGPTSGPITAMVNLAAETETPIISEAAGTVALNELGGEWVYRTVPSDVSGGQAAAEWFDEQGIGSLGILLQNEESPKTEGLVVREAFVEAGGEVVAEADFEAGQTSYQAVLQGVLDADPEMIFLAAGQESGVTIIREARQAGYEGGIFVSGDMVVPEVLEAIGGETGDLYGQAPESDTSLPAYQDFAGAFEEAYGEEPGLYAANAYDAVNLVALAAVAADSTCGADINSQLDGVSAAPGTAVTSFEEGAAALAEGEEINYEGTSGPVDLDETGSVAGAYGIFQAQEGSWEQIQFYPADTFQQ